MVHRLSNPMVAGRENVRSWQRIRLVNPAVVQIRTKDSTVCHACADRTLDIIKAANADGDLIAGQGDPRHKTRKCRHCGLRRRLWWFTYEYGLDAHARVVPLEASVDQGGKDES